MDNFKDFQLTTEEAAMVTGARKGKGKKRKLFKSLSEEDRGALKADLSELRSSEGWGDLSKEDRRAAKNDLFKTYAEGTIAVDIVMN